MRRSRRRDERGHIGIRSGDPVHVTTSLKELPPWQFEATFVAIDLARDLAAPEAVVVRRGRRLYRLALDDVLLDRAADSTSRSSS